jgi:hypothetical protein
MGSGPGWCDVVVVGDVCEARERGSEQVMIGCESWGSSLFSLLGSTGES